MVYESPSFSVTINGTDLLLYHYHVPQVYSLLVLLYWCYLLYTRRIRSLMTPVDIQSRIHRIYSESPIIHLSFLHRLFYQTNKIAIRYYLLQNNSHSYYQIQHLHIKIREWWLLRYWLSRLYQTSSIKWTMHKPYPDISFNNYNYIS